MCLIVVDDGLTNTKRGNNSFRDQDFANAVKWYTAALDESPTSHVMLGNRSASYLSLGKFKEALDDAERCIKTKPDWLKGHFRKGNALMSLERYSDAVSAFGEALKLEPGNTEVEGRIAEAKAGAAKVAPKAAAVVAPSAPKPSGEKETTKSRVLMCA